ncbi:MAG: DUF21 domain-containing protein [Planctomycetota bacterium]|nr:DUF21 domain-containing protein [Planctomycetota bacterium]
MWWLILIIALLASSLFAGSETGYYGTNALRLKHQAKESRNSALLEKTIRQPSAFLATLLIGNNIANDVAVHAAVMLFAASGFANNELLATLALAPLVFFVGEMWPKQYMLANPNRLLWFSVPLALCRVLLWPITQPITLLVSKLDSGAGDSMMRRNQFVSLLHDSQQQASGEAQVMSAAIRAIESKGQGLRQYLRYDVPSLQRDTSVAEARRQMSSCIDAKGLVFRENGPPSILFASRLVDTHPDSPLLPSAVPLISLSPSIDLADAVRHLQIYGISHAWVEEKEQRAGLLDLEYALASLLSSRPQ